MQYKGCSEKMNDLEKKVIEASKKIAADNKLSFKLDAMHFNKVKEFDFAGKKAVVIYVPCNEIEIFRKESAVCGAFEKQLNAQVHIVANRQIEHRTPAAYRPFCKTSVSVHQQLLEDLVAPGYISGKRTVYSNGTKTHKFYIAKVKKTEVDNRVSLCSKVYEKLTGMKNEIDFQ